MLNFWAFVLDAMAIAIASILISWRQELALWQLVLGGIIFIVVLKGGITVHLSYGRKLSIYQYLLRKNRRMLRPDTFAKYLSVPCHRLVVLAVLKRLGRVHEYWSIMRKYYVPPWKRLWSLDGEAIIFKTQEEAKHWLEGD